MNFRDREIVKMLTISFAALFLVTLSCIYCKPIIQNEPYKVILKPKDFTVEMLFEPVGKAAGSLEGTEEANGVAVDNIQKRSYSSGHMHGKLARMRGGSPSNFNSFSKSFHSMFGG